ncbi:MAG: Flp pilus assembly protein CpaB [Actinomycetota bacterium]
MRRRWSRASKLFALASVACGALSFLLVRGYAARLEALRPAVGTPVPVVVAAEAVARGTVLGEDALRIQEIPSAFAPPGALRSIDQALGRTVGSALAVGEPLTETRLGAADAGPVASLVPSGLRAFSVEADVPTGSVGPGDRVDVLATFGGPHPHTKTVAEGLEVLLVVGDDGGGGLAPTGASAPSLVLVVSAEDAERLAYAKAFADLSVAIQPAEP